MNSNPHHFIVYVIVLLGVSLSVFSASALDEYTAIGEYINPLNSDDCLEINTDKTCYIEILGLNMGTTGQWKLNNERISLLFPDGTTFRGTVKTDAILLEGFGALPAVWIKPTKSPPRLRDVAGRYAKEGHPDEYLVLDTDGTYTKTERGIGNQLLSISGEWEPDGYVVTLLPLGDRTLALSVAVLENRLYFTGLFGTDVWIGETREEPTEEKEAVPSGKPPEVEWEKTFDTGSSDWGIGVQELRDGGYVILALTIPETDSNGSVLPITWLIKTDESGDVKWDRHFSESKSVGNFVQQTSDGGFIIAGTIPGTPGGDLGEDAW